MAQTRAEKLEAALSKLLKDGPVTIAGVEINSCVLTDDKNTIKLRSKVGSFEDDFVITNPPLLVDDPNGAIKERGRKFREDPVVAITQAIRLYANAREGRVVATS